jgi:hypothetical protein
MIQRRLHPLDEERGGNEGHAWRAHEQGHHEQVANPWCLYELPYKYKRKLHHTCGRTCILPRSGGIKFPSWPCRLGYARVSTYGQTLDAQLKQLCGAGCVKIYREKVTGSTGATS